MDKTASDWKKVNNIKTVTKFVLALGLSFSLIDLFFSTQSVISVLFASLSIVLYRHLWSRLDRRNQRAQEKWVIEQSPALNRGEQIAPRPEPQPPIRLAIVTLVIAVLAFVPIHGLRTNILPIGPTLYLDRETNNVFSMPLVSWLPSSRYTLVEVEDPLTVIFSIQDWREDSTLRVSVVIKEKLDDFKLSAFIRQAGVSEDESIDLDSVLCHCLFTKFENKYTSQMSNLPLRSDGDSLEAVTAQVATDIAEFSPSCGYGLSPTSVRIHTFEWYSHDTPF